jgi:hypothetical protein
MRTPSSVLALAAIVFLTACGTTKIDSKKAESFITSTVADQVGAHVKSVDCPSGKTAKKGDSFSCTVVGADGSKGPVSVTELDTKGNVHVSAPFVHTREIEASIASGLGKIVHQTVRIGCPEIIVAKKGGIFDCSAIDKAGKTARVEAVQKDAAGHVRFRLIR